MLSRKIENARVALGELAGKVGQEEWAIIHGCRLLLEDARESAEELELRLVPPYEAEAVTNGAKGE